MIISRYLLKQMNECLKEKSKNSPLINIENEISIQSEDNQNRLAQEIMEAILELDNPREKEVLAGTAKSLAGNRLPDTSKPPSSKNYRTRPG